MAENANNPNPDTRPPAPELPGHPDEGLWLVSYADDDDRELTALQISAALARGEIDSNTIVWRDGMPEWKPIAEVESLKAQLRRSNLAPETLRKRQTVIGGFGPARVNVPADAGSGDVELAARNAATVRAPASHPDPSGRGGLSDVDVSEPDEDEPTVVQPMFTEASFAAAAEAGKTLSSSGPVVRGDGRSRHPTAGNTLRIRTGEPPPVAPKPHAAETPAPDFYDSLSQASTGDADLDSLPSNLLLTAPDHAEVAPPAAQRRTGAPPPPTRGVMTRHSDPPGSGPLGSSIPRATLTRDEDAGHATISGETKMGRRTDAPKPPVPKRTALADEAESIAPDQVTSVVSSIQPDPSPISSDAPTPRAVAALSADFGRTSSTPAPKDRRDVEDLANQRTRPPRSRRSAGDRPTPTVQHPARQEMTARANDEILTEPPQSLPTQGKRPFGSGLLLALVGIAAVAAAFLIGRNAGQPTPDDGLSRSREPAVANENPVPSSAVSEQASKPATSTVSNSVASATAAMSDPTTAATATVEADPSEVAKPATSPQIAPTPVANNLSPSDPSAAHVTAKSTAPLAAGAAVSNDNGSSTAPKTIAPKTTAPGATAAPSTAPVEPLAASADDGQFNASAAATALGNAAARASSCRKEGDPSGVARVTVTFSNSGSATRAIVDGPPFAGTATGGCIAETMRGATVPPFTGDRVTVKKTVVIQ